MFQAWFTQQRHETIPASDLIARICRQTVTIENDPSFSGCPPLQLGVNTGNSENNFIMFQTNDSVKSHHHPLSALSKDALFNIAM